jgi:hypothetical protein
VTLPTRVRASSYITDPAYFAYPPLSGRVAKAVPDQAVS